MKNLNNVLTISLTIMYSKWVWLVVILSESCVNVRFEHLFFCAYNENDNQ